MTVFLAAMLLVTGGCGNAQPVQGGSQPAPTQGQGEKQAKTLFAYVGANLKDPVSELAASYEQKTGVKVEMTFNNSGSLLTQIETAKKGDIYIPGGVSAVDQVKQKGLVDQVSEPLAYPAPVIITPKGNPAHISSVEDLAKDGVKLVIPDKDATAIGKSAYKVFAKIGKTAEIEKNIVASVESPAKVLATIEMGQGNAGIVEFSNTLKDKDKIDVVEIDPKVNVVDQVTVASLTCAADKETANDFLNYLQENGPAVFAKYGFKTQKPE